MGQSLVYVSVSPETGRPFTGGSMRAIIRASIVVLCHTATEMPPVVSAPNPATPVSTTPSAGGSRRPPTSTARLPPSATATAATSSRSSRSRTTPAQPLPPTSTATASTKCCRCAAGPATTTTTPTTWATWWPSPTPPDYLIMIIRDSYQLFCDCLLSILMKSRCRVRHTALWSLRRGP